MNDRMIAFSGNESATAVFDNPDATQENVNGAVSALEAAVSTFNGVKAAGTKDDGGSEPSTSPSPSPSPSAKPQTPASRPSTSSSSGSSSAPAAAAPAAIPASNYGTSPQTPGLWHKVNTEVARIDGAGPAGENFNHIVNTGADILVPVTVSDSLKKAGAAGAASYTVVRGDSMSQIARRNGMSLAQLMALNPGITNPNLIRPGAAVRLK